MKLFIKLSIAALALLILSAAAQSAEPPTKRGHLGLGRMPDADCRSFWLTEVAYLYRFSQDYDKEPWPGYYSSHNNVNFYFSADVGWMKNLKNRNAIGGTLYIGLDDMGSRVALKPRYRRWLTRTIHADLSLGMILLITGGWDNAAGFTGNISIGIKDLVSVIVQYETIPYEAFPRDAPMIKGTERTLYGGIKVGSFAGAAVMVIAPITLGVYWIIALAGSN